MTGRPLRVGLSTCPNDTFLFHALLEGEVRADGLELEFELADVEELNRRMLAGELDVAKTSFHAMLAMSERIWVLESGSALGFGQGPLLLAAPGRDQAFPLAPGSRVLGPGTWTTAALLLRLLHPSPLTVEPVVFSDILPRLRRGEADYGLCIHEARFTWREQGLGWVADLGELWERATRVPLPLGGLCARRSLGRETVGALAQTIRASLEWGWQHRERCLPTLRRYAQELSDPVLWAHVDLYVNEWTLALGPLGRQALRELARLSRAAGILPAGHELEVIGPPSKNDEPRRR